MEKKNNKNRLFEVMSKLDESFVPKVNEEPIGMKPTFQPRPLSAIAQEIYRLWRPVSPYAKPYLEAMSSLESIKDNYMHDSGDMIVRYFLSNASSWKGEDAKRIKLELNTLLKQK